MKKPTTILIMLCMALISLQACVSIKPTGTIKGKQAKEYKERYERTRSVVIDNALNYTDTREVWFELERVKQYIAYVESQAKNKNYKNLGLRVYFGAYAKDAEGKSYTTIFFVPTSKPDIEANKSSRNVVFANSASSDENDNIYDIDPLNFGGLGHPPKEYEPEED